MELKAGQSYSWCKCGRSTKQPLCDGAHRGITDAAGKAIEPLRFTPTGDMKVRFCACKLTKTPPFCDGAHLDLV